MRISLNEKRKKILETATFELDTRIYKKQDLSEPCLNF